MFRLELLEGLESGVRVEAVIVDIPVEVLQVFLVGTEI